MQEMWVWSLGQEDPLEKEMATHSSVLAWKISWTEEPGRLQSMGLRRARHNWAHMHTLSWQLCIPCSGLLLILPVLNLIFFTFDLTLLFFLYWSVIALQCWFGFCCIHFIFCTCAYCWLYLPPATWLKSLIPALLPSEWKSLNCV